MIYQGKPSGKWALKCDRDVFKLGQKENTNCLRKYEGQEKYLVKHLPQTKILTDFGTSRRVNFAFCGTGGKAVSRCWRAQFGIPAILHNIIAIHSFYGEELRATQNVYYIVPKHTCCISSFLKGAADVCPAIIL